MCQALAEALDRHGIPDQILTDNGKVFTGKLLPTKPNVLFDRVCHNNGIRHPLTAPYSPTTTGKVERLHRTMRREFFDSHRFDTIEQTQTALDEWVSYYNHEREHQSIGDVAPIRRFELAPAQNFTVVDGDAEPVVGTAKPKRGVMRRVDSSGRVAVVNHRYYLGKQYGGQTVMVEAEQGLFNFLINGAVVATYAKRHTPAEEEKLLARPRATRPKDPTLGHVVTRLVDSSGSVSFAATTYRVGNTFKGRQVDVRIVGDTVQISADEKLVRTHKSRHDPNKVFSAFGTPNGRPNRSNGVA